MTYSLYLRFFSNLPLLPPSASPQERETVFGKFLDEAKSAFKKYQVVFLKGVSIPQQYEDLIKPCKKSNYSDVNWNGCQPAGNNFSLEQYSLSSEERDAHNLYITSRFTNAVVGWKQMAESSFHSE